MKLARVGLIATAILAVAVPAWAQRPDFSGTWTLGPGARAGAGGGGGGGGRGGGGGALGNGPATVRQTADALMVDFRPLGDAVVTLTFKLDGTESRNIMKGRRGEPVDSVSTVRWDGPRLTIVTKQEIDGQVVVSTQVWTVAGSTLTVETTNPRGTQTRVDQGAVDGTAPGRHSAPDAPAPATTARGSSCSRCWPTWRGGSSGTRPS